MITINIDKAKAIAHDIRRAARAEEFKPLDVKATIPAEAAEAEAARQAVRDKAPRGPRDERDEEFQRDELPSREQALVAGGDEHRIGRAADLLHAAAPGHRLEVGRERQQQPEDQRQTTLLPASVRERDVGDLPGDADGVPGEEAGGCRPAQDARPF